MVDGSLFMMPATIFLHPEPFNIVMPGKIDVKQAAAKVASFILCLFICNASICQSPILDKAIEKVITPISSLDTSDYSDLGFLTGTLKNKRIVMLGEFSHGVKEINILKIRLIKFLHEKMGYNVLVFESDLAAVAAMNAQKMTMDYANLVYQGLPGIWYTHEYREFMKYLKENPKLQLAGVDPQYQTSNTKFYLKRLLYKIDSVAANQVFYAEQSAETFFRKIRDTSFIKSKEFVIKLDSCLGNYAIVKKSLSTYKKLILQQGFSDVQYGFIERIPDTRIKALQYLSKYQHDFSNRFTSRDSIMAEGLQWIIDEVYPAEKIIVSAHNYHISKIAGELPVMVSLLPDKLKNQSYVIGVFGLQGEYGDNSGNPVSLKSATPNSIRYKLSSLQYEYSFIPFKKLRKSKNWINQVTEAEGFVNISGNKNLVLGKSFDGIIVIKNISVPKYLFK